MDIAAPGLTDVNGPTGDGHIARTRALAEFKACRAATLCEAQLGTLVQLARRMHLRKFRPA